MSTKTIWITGVTSGLGRALVDEFTSAGHVVVGCGRRNKLIEELQHDFPAPHFFSTVDVAHDDQVAEFCQAAKAVAGPPDLLLNNAAIVNDPAPLWKISADEFDRLTSININGTANMIRHALPMMIDHGRGVLVNFSSGWGRSTSPEVAPYCASKWAIEGLTQALAQELPTGIGTIALNPGVINTDMLQTCWKEHASSYDNATTWASTAASFLLSLKPSQNGQALTAP
jgi:NAD(P)-dependent dehydrogenase (short-subunit alcohol dehydrogenase family)